MPFAPTCRKHAATARRVTGVRRGARVARLAVLVVVAAAALAGPLGPVRAAGASTVATPALGAYLGPAGKNIAGATAFNTWSGTPVRRLLDFLPQTSWLEMTRNAWALTPYTGTGYQLELSVPMLPAQPSVSLAACANGDYDAYWTSIATSLVNAGLAGTRVRPGWEMNGNWMGWSAVGRADAYAGCFRHLVRAMRSVPGQALTFVFNPAVGKNSMNADDAWPGDDYVDVVSLDIYDQSWSYYPTPAGMTTDTARARNWTWLRTSDHGLDFWSQYARDHGKPLAFSEWGLSWRSDGHGGGDDPGFVDRMFDYATDPLNRVAYLNYFNSPDTADLKHDLMRADTAFPLAAARYKARAAQLAASSVAPSASSTASTVPAASPNLTTGQPATSGGSTTPVPVQAPTPTPTPSPSSRPTPTPSPTPTPKPSPTKMPDTTAPTRVGHLGATGGRRRITVTWQAAHDDVGVTGYRLYRSGRYVTTLRATARRYVSTGLHKNVKRTYRVVAVDAAGNRGAASSASARAR